MGIKIESFPSGRGTMTSQSWEQPIVRYVIVIKHEQLRELEVNLEDGLGDEGKR